MTDEQLEEYVHEYMAGLEEQTPIANGVVYSLAIVVGLIAGGAVALLWLAW